MPPLFTNKNKKYILLGTTIYSDGWWAYLRLDKEGYTHQLINHFKEFTDLDHDIHIQNIQRFWRDVNEWVKRPGNIPEYYHQYLSYYLFIHKFITTDFTIYLWRLSA